ncbi:MAG: SpoIIE family protein phosphatase [Eubacterium sp.]|nr:SpoIIE family protein phosphatase [Eubacterium sp.]
MNASTGKKRSLVTKFMIMFIVFGIFFLIMNALYTFSNQTLSYHNKCKNNLKNITRYLDTLIRQDGKEFVELKEYFHENYSQMRIPADYSGDYHPALAHFEELFSENYPDKEYGKDILFKDLEGDTKKAYAEYRLEYWISVFTSATESFDLSYTYFLYPDEEPVMYYLIDPVPDAVTIDGKKYISLGFHGAEDSKKYPMMWEAWHTGKQPESFDIFDNEYGNTYAYYSPVIIDGEKIGLVCADLNVETVTRDILMAVVNQTLGSLIVFIVGVLIIIALIKKIFLNRLLRLEKSVALYAKEKDAAISTSIMESEQGNDEIRSLSDQFAGMIIEITDYMENLKRITAEKERIGAELNVATQIQADMLPRIFPPFPERKEFSIYATMNPAKEVGGDFYDFFLVDDDHIALVVADVSGKGIPAALFMVIAKTLIKNRTLMGESPAEVLKNVNNQLCEGNEAEMFVTVWLAVIQISTGKGIAANAGHEHPALRRRDGHFELVKYRHSPAVATIEGIRYREHEFELHPGDMIFQYTDGVSEATNSNDELFGEERLVRALNLKPESEPEDLLCTVRKEIDAFVGEAPQFDDITMLGFAYYGREDDGV